MITHRFNSLRFLTFHPPRLLPKIPHRHLHSSLPSPPVPEPTPEVPDIPTFLRLIGRNAIQHQPKFTNWTQFFSATSAQLKEVGLEPARDRRYIIHWREKFRATNGECKLHEIKRGRKIFGGERRRKEILAKKRAEENKERKRQEAAAAAAAPAAPA